MKKVLLIVIIMIVASNAFAQAPFIQWQRALGGPNPDFGQSIIKTIDNNIALIGTTGSSVSWPDIHNQHQLFAGATDIWFVKFDNTGSINFNSCFGGGYDEYGYGITETSSGRIALFGTANSDDQYVTGVHGGILDDYWLVQLDSVFNVQWEHCYGNIYFDRGYALKSTNDNGFILLGQADGDGGDITNAQGSYDAWAVKTDSAGNIQWQIPLGGNYDENGNCIMLTEDGGYLMGCIRSSVNGNISCTDAQKEIWVVKLDSTGVIQWDHCYGGSGYDGISAFLPASNGSYYAAGYSSSIDGDISHPNGMLDGWLFKADSVGNIIWEKSFGGSDWDAFTSMTYTSDHAIVCSGGSRSPEFNFHGGNMDAYVVKIDTSGNLIWQSCYGGSGDDYSNSIVEASDSSLFFVGYSTSDDGDLNHNYGDKDMWVVKLESPTSVGLAANENMVYNLSAYHSNGLLKINFISLRPENFAFKIYDLSGRELNTFNYRSQAGENHYEKSIELNHGIYLLQIISSSGIESRRIGF